MLLKKIYLYESKAHQEEMKKKQMAEITVNQMGLGDMKENKDCYGYAKVEILIIKDNMVLWRHRPVEGLRIIGTSLE